MNESVSEQLNLLFQQACLSDVSALKPGNVGLHAAGHNMCARDFMLSAAASKVICQHQLTLGERVLRTIQATQLLVECNTNLGIVLLCAPVVQAVMKYKTMADLSRQSKSVSGESVLGWLRQNIISVLDQADVADTENIFSAIRLANPGGLGKVANADISEVPKIGLRAAMKLAQERDTIARQYVDGYALIFEEIIPKLLEFHSLYGYHCWAVARTYLSVLADCPDSLITRKHGLVVSKEVSRRIGRLLESLEGCDIQKEVFCQFEQVLLELDGNLKQEHINPGTTADLIVASVFIASLEGTLCNNFA